VSQLELTERILRLRAVPTLRTLSASELAQLAGALRSVVFRRDEVLLSEDEPPRSFYLITSGTVAMRRRNKRIGTVRGPGAVGFVSFLARNAGGTAAVAESFVEALEVQADAMEEIFEDHFPVLLGTMRFVAERLLGENRVAPPAPYVAPVIPYDAMIGERPLDIVERIFLLRRMRVFAEANVNSLAGLARTMTEERPGAGVKLWKAGDRAEHSYFVVKGMLSLTWNEGRSVQRVGPGYVLGGMESLVEAPRWNDLVTDEPAVVLRGTRDSLIDLFEDDYELALRFQAMLAGFLVTVWDRKADGGIASVGSPESAAPAPAAPAVP
jgi:CRP-like cAMP-binding protein